MSKVLSQDLKGNAATTGIQTGNVLNRRLQSHQTNYNSSLWKHNSNLCPNLLTHSRLVPSKAVRSGGAGGAVAPPEIFKAKKKKKKDFRFSNSCIS